MITGQLQYTGYNNITGELGGVSLYNQTNIMELMSANSELGFIEGAYNSLTQYIDVSNEIHVLVERPIMPVVLDKTTLIGDGVDFFTIIGVSTGAWLLIEDMLNDYADGTDIEITLDMSGVHRLRIELFPYQVFQEVINAN